MTIDSKKKALEIAKAASSKKALDIVTIDMRDIPNIADYFVVTGGTSTTHVKAIADHIEKKLKEKGQRLWHSEGEREALWVLLDFGDVVAHVFYDETRRFYDLEKLWGDAPQAKFREVRKKRTAGHVKKLKRPGKTKKSKR